MFHAYHSHHHTGPLSDVAQGLATGGDIPHEILLHLGGGGSVENEAPLVAGSVHRGKDVLLAAPPNNNKDADATSPSNNENGGNNSGVVVRGRPWRY
jgi:hypothetical protein